mmetsp:Transcript_11562/g.21206  ORF Transcript_11562/g.21206 Transcript_11562/m.21206 type:complete len:204 (+) Transcript_11562:417-1028(+)
MQCTRSSRSAPPVAPPTPDMLSQSCASSCHRSQSAFPAPLPCCCPVVLAQGASSLDGLFTVAGSPTGSGVVHAPAVEVWCPCPILSPMSLDPLRSGAGSRCAPGTVRVLSRSATERGCTLAPTNTPLCPVQGGYGRQHGPGLPHCQRSPPGGCLHPPVPPVCPLCMWRGSLFGTLYSLHPAPCLPLPVLPIANLSLMMPNNLH